MPRLLGSERTVGVGVGHEIGLDLAHLKRGRALVLEHARELVHDASVSAVRHFLHERLAQPHVHASLDLAHYRGGIDALTYVVCDPHFRHPNDAGIGLHVHLGDGGAVRIRW